MGEGVPSLVLFVVVGCTESGLIDSKSPYFIREKKITWTPERLRVDLPDAFKVLLCHARQLNFDEESDYDGLQQVFIDEMKRHGYSMSTTFDWSEAGDTKGNLMVMMPVH
jgi:hypothetical protein